MNDRQKLVETVIEQSMIAVVRMKTSQHTLSAIGALQQGGISCIEVSMTTPGALRAIEAAALRYPHGLLGVGTVLDAATAQNAILAGARFIVTPTFAPDVIRVARSYGVVTIIGAMSPTEILAAWKAGADFVKVFPARVLGAEYIRAIRAPLPQIPIIPTGGISVNNATEFLAAGAVAVCAGGQLVSENLLVEGRCNEIASRAASFLSAIQAFKTNSPE